MASLVSLVGIKLDSGEAPDSMDLSGALLGGRGPGRKSLVHHQGGANSPLAFREGRWVIVPKKPFGWELYDLSKDLSQTKDLASQNPEIVERMKASLEKAKLGGTR